MSRQRPGTHALVAAYALHALPADEAAEFDVHQRGCGPCRHEVAELRDLAATLAVAVAIRPPARIREQVMASIVQVRPLPPVLANGYAPEAAAGHWRRWRPRLRSVPGSRR